jgi:hypothetical protein
MRGSVSFVSVAMVWVFFVIIGGTATFSVDSPESLLGGLEILRGGRVGSEIASFFEQQLLKQQNRRHKPAIQSDIKL